MNLTGTFGLRVEGGGMEGSRVKLAKIKFTFGQFCYILLYFLSLPFNPNRPLDKKIAIRTRERERNVWGEMYLLFKIHQRNSPYV